MRYPNTLILRQRGGGKSVTARAIAQQYHDEDNMKIVSNMTMYGLKNYVYKKFSEIKEMLPDLTDCVLIIDEGQKGNHAYDFFRTNVRKFNEWLSELRKRRIQLFFITQHFEKLAKQFRNDVEYIMIPNKLPNDVYRVDVFDLSKPKGQDLINQFWFNGKDYYDLYLTEEIIYE